MKKIKKIKADFYIQDGVIRYDNQSKLEKDLYSLKSDNEREWGICTFEIIDRVQFYLHKYYRGAVLLELAQSKDATDIYLTHMRLKKEFLFHGCINFDDVPDKYMENGVAIVDYDDLFSVVVPSGRTILVMSDKELIGYIPSHGSITHNQMKQFITMCEDLRDNMISWSPTEELLYYRKMGFEL